MVVVTQAPINKIKKKMVTMMTMLVMKKRKRKTPSGHRRRTQPLEPRYHPQTPQTMTTLQQTRG
jgi:hypothetical protein